MSVDVGTRLGSLEITALLGKGSMGEVYRVRDAKLKREVAIKILPDEFSREPERVAPFQREAEVFATFDHPDGVPVNAEAQFSRGVDYHSFARSPVRVQTSEAFVNSSIMSSNDVRRNSLFAVLVVCPAASIAAET